MQKEPIIFKVVAVGQSGVGKTSLIYNYIKGTFKIDYNVTIGVEFYTKNLCVDGHNIQLQIWDTAGQEVYKSIVRSFYRGTSAILIMFALDSEDSFNSVKQWLKEVKDHVHPEACIFLVGTKLDRDQERQVSSDKAQKLLSTIGGVSYTETSAKSGQNIQTLFKTTGSLLLKKCLNNKEFKQLVSPSEKQTQRKETRLTGKSFSLRRPSVDEGPRSSNKTKCC